MSAIDSYTRYPFGFFLKKRRMRVSSDVVAQARDAIGDALAASAQAGPNAAAIVNAAQDAFLRGMHTGLVVCAAAAALGVAVTLKWLPSRARADQPATQPARAGHQNPGGTVGDPAA